MINQENWEKFRDVHTKLGCKVVAGWKEMHNCMALENGIKSVPLRSILEKNAADKAHNEQEEEKLKKDPTFMQHPRLGCGKPEQLGLVLFSKDKTGELAHCFTTNGDTHVLKYDASNLPASCDVNIVPEDYGQKSSTA